MRITPVLFAVALGSCSGSIEEAEAPNRAALECQRRLAGTQLPRTFEECLPLGLVENHSGGRVCRYETHGDELVRQCTVAGGYGPIERPWGGGIDCAVTYSEDGACKTYVQVYGP